MCLNLCRIIFSSSLRDLIQLANFSFLQPPSHNFFCFPNKFEYHMHDLAWDWQLFRGISDTMIACPRSVCCFAVDAGQKKMCTASEIPTFTKWEGCWYEKLCRNPTDSSTTLELQNPSHDVPESHESRLSPGFDTLKLWKVGLGKRARPFNYVYCCCRVIILPCSSIFYYYMFCCIQEDKKNLRVLNWDSVEMIAQNFLFFWEGFLPFIVKDSFGIQDLCKLGKTDKETERLTRTSNSGRKMPSKEGGRIFLFWKTSNFQLAHMRNADRRHPCCFTTLYVIEKEKISIGRKSFSVQIENLGFQILLFYK